MRKPAFTITTSDTLTRNWGDSFKRMIEFRICPIPKVTTDIATALTTRCAILTRMDTVFGAASVMLFSAREHLRALTSWQRCTIPSAGRWWKFRWRLEAWQ